MRSLLTVDDLPPSVHATILERAEGNPFYIEEIVRRLIDEGAVVQTGDRWLATDTVASIDIPDTVQGVLAARIDLLDPEDKRVVQAAAVVGRAFWPGPVAELTGLEPSVILDAAASCRGPRARALEVRIVDRGTAGVSVQAHPHARRGLRVAPTPRSRPGASPGGGLAATQRGRASDGVRRAARLPPRRPRRISPPRPARSTPTFGSRRCAGSGPRRTPRADGSPCARRSGSRKRRSRFPRRSCSGRSRSRPLGGRTSTAMREIPRTRRWWRRPPFGLAACPRTADRSPASSGSRASFRSDGPGR